LLPPLAIAERGDVNYMPPALSIFLIAQPVVHHKRAKRSLSMKESTTSIRRSIFARLAAWRVANIRDRISPSQR